MSLKHTLSALCVVGTGVAGGYVGADTHASEKMPQVSVTDHEAQFHKNFDHLYQNLSGAWFSFGDEKLMRQALYYIASTPHGRHVIAGSPENLKLSSARFLGDFKAYYFPAKNEIKMASEEISSDEMKKIGTALFLAHELLHGWQKNNGITTENAGFSCEQAILLDKIQEAETMAWQGVMEVSYFLFDGAGKNIGVGERSFLSYDFIKIGREEAHKKNNPFDEKAFRTTNPYYLMQQAYKKTKNRERAEKLVVGQLMRLFMRAQTDYPLIAEWREMYDKQAVSNMEIDAKNCQLTHDGNNKRLAQILNYYASQYHINVSDINKANLASAGQKLYQEKMAEIKRMGYLEKGDKRYGRLKQASQSVLPGVISERRAR